MACEDMPRRRSHVAASTMAVRAVLAVMMVWLLGYQANVMFALAPVEGVLLGKPAHLVIGFAGALLCLAAALRHSGGHRVGWLLVGVGIIAWNAGDVYWTTVLLDDADLPVPSPADVGYLSFPVLAFAGLLVLLRTEVRSASRLRWIDGLAAALAAGAVAAAIVFDAVSALVEDADAHAVATNLAYPVTDLVLLGGHRGRDRPAWLADHADLGAARRRRRRVLVRGHGLSACAG
jgi:hypothetical protein